MQGILADRLYQNQGSIMNDCFRFAGANQHYLEEPFWNKHRSVNFELKYK
jgi:hypothetical protein